MMGAGFWLAIAFGLLCVAAGWAVARLGPTLLAPAPAAAPSLRPAPGGP
jgi:hypothetical protein